MITPTTESNATIRTDQLERYLRDAAKRLNRLDAEIVRAKRTIELKRRQAGAMPDGARSVKRAERTLDEATYLLVKANNLYSRGMDISHVRASLDRLVDDIARVCSAK